MRKYLRDGKLLLLALRGFGLVGCEGRDVDQGGDLVVRPGMGDQGATVRVADKDYRTADPPEAAGNALHVAFQESRPCWEHITSCPSACSAGISFWKHEPSAQSPWANTMLGLVCVDMVHSLFYMRTHINWAEHMSAGVQRAIALL